jgi:hypothetical protein
MKFKTVLRGAFVIFVVWLSSAVGLWLSIDSLEERAQFGDMFGAVNSLFSGLALCGIAYSLILQSESNKFSEYQFRFTRVLDIINGQIEIFNTRLSEFNFWVAEGKSENFSNGIIYFKKHQSDDFQKDQFLSKNSDMITSILSFIFYSNKFVHDLINEELISKEDKDKLKKIYLTSQNRFLIDFYSLNTEMIAVEKREYENMPDGLKEISKAIVDIRIDMTKSILTGEYN